MRQKKKVVGQIVNTCSGLRRFIALKKHNNKNYKQKHAKFTLSQIVTSVIGVQYFLRNDARTVSSAFFLCIHLQHYKTVQLNQCPKQNESCQSPQFLPSIKIVVVTMVTITKLSEHADWAVNTFKRNLETKMCSLLDILCRWICMNGENRRENACLDLKKNDA